jgi:hypothetical protein
MDFDKVSKDSKSLGETKDCAVKAVAIVTNTPYKVVHAMMAKHGRKPRRGTPMGITHKVLKELGVWVERCDDKFRSRTVNQLKSELPKTGRFLVRTRGHILACVNGKVMDWTDGRRHRPKEFFQISF